ncbi:MULTISPECIES: hypothetical protein [Streptomyces]|uniref:hypothetical protein n=1 Tax=Streptomyces TaxID=1883 RepID=UPI0017AB403D|nr:MULTISPECIES: hypothetical protein [Streptomyces]MBB4161478.1 hypothetical protein [Streptomyces cinereoruber]NIH60774.1 hypothetical protein [Streptomyces cinereoruber]
MTATDHGPVPVARPSAPPVQDVARREGLAPALRLLLREHGPRSAPRGPSGFALLPEDWAAGCTVLRRYPLAGGPVVVVRDPRPAPEGGGGALDRSELLRLRLGVVEGLRDACVDHLAARPSGESTVLMQPMVKGQLAEALAQQLELSALLDSGTRPQGPFLRNVHGQITRNGRSLLRLLGAYGYLADGPGATAEASELLADIHDPVKEDR